MKIGLKGIKFSGLVFAPVDPGGGTGGSGSAQVADSSTDEQFDMLMSLALDDMLGPDETVQFSKMVADDPELGDIWNEWQEFDHAFQSAPSIDPPSDFVSSFEGRMLRREKRRRLWLGVGISLVAVALWSSLIMGLTGAGAYVMFNQSDWLTATVRFLVYGFASVQSYVSVFASTVATALATPQLQGIAVAYIAFGLFALWIWAMFLRRSVARRGVNPVAVS
jgi:hypothetical protein